MREIDETAEKSPEWYNAIVSALLRDKPEEALRQALEALGNCRKASDRAGEVAALRAVTKANIAKGDLWNAKRNADEGLQCAKDAGDKSGEAAALHVLAALHLKEKKLDQAKFRALAALDAYKAQQNKLGEACASNTLALAYVGRKEHQEAQELALQAIKIFREQAQSSGVAYANYTIVQILLQEGKLNEALEKLHDTAKIYSGVDDYTGMGLCYLLIAEINMQSNDLQDAINKASSAAEVFESSGDVKLRGRSVFLMARAFELAEQVEDAWSCAESAYAFFDEARDSKGKAACMELAGRGANLLRDFKSAVYCFENAAFLSRQLKDRPKEAEMLNSLAKAQLASFDSPADAPPEGWGPDEILAPVRNSKRSCALYIELGSANSAGHGLALQTLALALLNTTAHEEAFGRALEAQKIFKRLGDLAGEAGAVVTTAQVLVSQNQKDQALTMLEEDAMKLAQESEEAEVISMVQAEIDRVQKLKKPKPVGPNKVAVDIFVGFRGEEKVQFTNFESRSMSVPTAPMPSKKGQKDRLVSIEAAPRALQQQPVLFEAKKIPAASIIERSA